MYVRLGFAVAAHLEPDILIVDEVLAVGDAEFQQKCLGKMDDVSRREGRTVLLVSHNVGVIHKLCPTSIWLDRGRIRRFGKTGEVIRDYLAQSGPNRAQIVELAHLRRQSVEGNEARLISLQWLSDLPLRHGEPAKARIVLETQRPVAGAVVALGFCDLTGRRILSYETDFADTRPPNLPRAAAYVVDVDIAELPLQPDTYALDIGCRSGETCILDYIPSAFQLEILDGPKTPRYIYGVRLKSRSTWNLSESDSGSDRIRVISA
jgi:lipopolysaccharide transport system ATP-binding protein